MTNTPTSTSTSTPTSCSTSDALKLRYANDSPSQYILLYSGTCTEEHRSVKRVVIFLHGDFWKPNYGIDPPSSSACDTIIPSMQSISDYTALIEYRRLSSDDSENEKSGFPHTNDDILQAYNYLVDYIQKCEPEEEAVELKIILLGHSAGGTLALWLLSKLQQQQQQQQQASIIHTFALAPVSNLCLGVDLRLSDQGNAIQRYMKGLPDEIPCSYQRACPNLFAEHLSNSCITFIIGDDDTDIPFRIISSCYESIKLHQQDECNNNTISLLRFENEDHYSIVSATSTSWETVARRMTQLFKLDIHTL